MSGVGPRPADQVLIPCRDSLFMERLYLEFSHYVRIVLIPCRDSLFMERQTLAMATEILLF